MTKSFVIRVPATSANIGPGFDVVGLSLSLYLTLTVTSGEPSSPLPEITYSGEGADEVPLDPYHNLTTRVALYVLRCNGHVSFPPDLCSIHCHNQIPFGRGLGSSGAAVIAGVLLGNNLGKLNLTQERILDYALMVERHPDNVTAALVGGFVGSYLRELDQEATEAAQVPLSEVLPEYPPDAGEDWGLSPPVPPLGIGHYVRFKWNSSIKVVAIIPRFELSTAKARAVLPDSYSRKDLVFNMQRLAVLTTALGQTPPDAELIFEAMKDRVHQPYRKILIPGFPAVTSLITPASHPGLLGICLSGAGPTILALATHNFGNIAEKIQEIFGQEEIEVDWKILEVAEGSTVDSHQNIAVSFKNLSNGRIEIECMFLDKSLASVKRFEASRVNKTLSGKLLESNALAISRDDQLIGFSFDAYYKPRSDVSSFTNTTFGSLVSVTNESDLEYLGKVNVGGHDFILMLDTGSSDLWVTGQQIKISNSTNYDLNLTYGIGSASGNIAYTTVQLGDYEVQNQAFLNVNKTYQQGVEGILGLGFISLSEIEKKINNKSARPIMANIFEKNPSTPKFMAMALERTNDKENTSGGVITIGQYDPRFNKVSGTTKYPLAPSKSSRWTITLSAMQVNGQNVTLKSVVDGVKKGTAISLIDSGTSLAYIPSNAVDAIYGAINGSIHINSHGQNFWISPCLGQANVSFSFGDELFSINPLELTTPVTITDNGQTYTVCVSAFRPRLSKAGSDMDFLLGDIFMRNVYSVFNFGNITSSNKDEKFASIQFLSRSNKDQVYQEFHQQRTRNLKNLAPLYDVSKINFNGTFADGGRIVDENIL